MLHQSLAADFSGVDVALESTPRNSTPVPVGASESGIKAVTHPVLTSPIRMPLSHPGFKCSPDIPSPA